MSSSLTMRIQWMKLLPVGALLFGAGCNSGDAERCLSGEGTTSKDEQYQACRRQCADVHQDACLKSKAIAPEVCKETDGENEEACSEACDGGDAEACGQLGIAPPAREPKS
ncbi:MAG: hypothetical protein HOW73_22175 [Polyangiaceae bacterium]|nr:hypothetical protein [Polyangiaceae bacterium]